MILLQHPSGIHTAFNPCIAKFEQVSPSELKARIYIVEGHQTDDSNIDNYITIEREFLNGYAVFDIRKSLVSLLNYRFDAAPQKVPIPDTPFWVDEHLVLNYTVFDDNWDMRFNATAINAVAQIQESSNLSAMVGKFATKFDKLRKYKSYPLEVVACALDVNEGEARIYFNGELAIPFSPSIIVVPIPENKTWVQIALDGYDEHTLSIENPITPENPFYVRWINRQGGYDYWMFSYRQFFNRNIASPQVFIPETTDQQTVSGFESLYSLTAEEFVRVGAQGLLPNEYDCLSKLPYSPKVEWFDEATQKFKTLIIQKGDSERDNRNILSELEFIFKLPTPQLQF